MESPDDADLFRRALSVVPGGRAYWNCVRALRGRATREVFVVAASLCRRRRSPTARRLGCDVLAQLGRGPRPFLRESVPVLLPRLRDRNERVVVSACYALGHLDAPLRSRALFDLRRHPNPDVRLAVAFGLGGQDDRRAVRILVELSADRDSDVRNWATFGLGSLIDLDGPAIRAALLARVRDGHQETRGEAILGLARRGDPRVLESLTRALEGTWVGSLAVEAAREVAHPSLFKSLHRLLSWWDVDERLLRDALQACRSPRRLE